MPKQISTNVNLSWAELEYLQLRAQSNKKKIVSKI